MLKDGTYSAWFKTPAGEGTGIVHLAAGKVVGSDTVLSYAGSYEIDGDRFTATIKTHRHAQGQPSVFGLDDLTISLKGSSNGTVARCDGFADEAPGLPFKVTLLLATSDDVKPPVTAHPAKTFALHKLPKLPLR